MALVVTDLAAGQWGLVTTPQAVAAGLSRIQLSRLCAAGILVRLTHGVYAVRVAIATENIELFAAWLALDPERPAADRLGDGPGGPVVSHASAAAFYGFGDLDADRHEFTTPARKQTRRADLRLHRGALPEGDVTLHRGLPVTTPARTIVDLLADGHDGGHVAGVLADAVRARQVDLDELGGRLAPFAARFGLARRDGEALLRHLLELGGAAEQADADDLASLARTNHLPVAAVAAALADHAAQNRVAEISRLLALPDVQAAAERAMPFQRIAALQAAINEQLSPYRRMAELQAAINEQQLSPYRRMQEAQQAWASQVAAVAAQQTSPVGLSAALALAQGQGRGERAETPQPPQRPGGDDQRDGDDQ
ncbi:transcriptional regulator [Pseudonocardia sp. K10HN5]|uniref:Transcriptional regulator n=1 Tax=Pseudonocardia acidicola TaxID=2724939 RepID=A0ABX1SAJ4_9PSEU|nr:transcriptional regulator [Pseudonocardia acidicola]